MIKPQRTPLRKMAGLKPNDKALGVLGIFVSLLVLAVICNQPHPHTLALLIDNSGSIAHEDLKLYQKVLREILENERGSTVHVYVFANETSTARLAHVDSGPNEKPEVLWKKVEAIITGPKSTESGTLYSTPLLQVAALCQRTSDPVYACMLSDGGDSYENWAASTAACQKLAKEPRFAGLLILPVKNGQLSQLLEEKIMPALGSKLLIGHDTDIAEKIRKFNDWEETANGR